LKTLDDINDFRVMGWSYNTISQYLNSRGIKSKNGGKWYSSSVRSVYMNGVMELENKSIFL
jgi:hypothetical protein